MGVKKKLLDIVRDTIRFKHYSLSTERTYIHWVKQYIFFITRSIQRIWVNERLKSI